MLVTVHNFPSHMQYSDIRLLLQSKCGFTEVILDNLVNEGSTKKVTVGLAEKEDATILARNINGLYVEGKQLYVEYVRQKKATEQPFYSRDSRNMAQKGLGYQSQASNQSQAGCQPSGNYQGQASFPMPMNQQAAFSQFGNQPLLGQKTVMPVMPPGMMGGWNGMYFIQPQNSFMDYAGKGQVAVASSQFSQPNPSQLNQTMGSGNGSYSNRYQGDKPRHLNPDNGSNNEDVQRSRGRLDDSRGRQSSSWSGDIRDGGGKRQRSRSPREQERFHDRRSSSPKRSKYDDQYHRDQPHNYNQSSQRQDSGRRETYNSQNRNNFRENDEAIASTYQPPDSWNRSDANSFRQSESGCNRPNPNSFGQSKNGRYRYNDAQTEGPSQRSSRLDEFQSQRAARPLGPQTERSFGPRADLIPVKQRKAEAAQQSGQSVAAAKPAQQPPESGPAEPQPADADRLTNALKRRDAAFRPQAAAFVVKMMLTEDLLTKLPEKYIGKQKLALRGNYTKAIKKEVNSRLEELLGDSLGNSIEEMTIKYRQKFPPEQNLEFILHILETTPKEEPKVKEPRDGKVKEKPAANAEENPALPANAVRAPPANGNSAPATQVNSAPPTQGNSAPTAKGNFAPPPKGNSAPPPKGNSAPPPKGNSAPPPKGNSAPPPKGNSAPPPKGNTEPPPKGNSAPRAMGNATAKKQDAGGCGSLGQTAKQEPPLASRDYIKVVLTAWQKKRLRELLEQGVSHEEALIQCLLGITIAKSAAAQVPNPDIQTEANSTMANTPSGTDKVSATPNVDITPGLDTDTDLAILTAINTPGVNTNAQPANPSAENSPVRRETVNCATSSNTPVRGNDWQSAGTSIRHLEPPANTSTRMRKEPPKTIPKRYVHNKGGIRAFSFIDPFLRVGITDLNRPLTREQEVKVLVYLFRLIETDMASGSELPRIRMISQPGWMLFACENKFSRRWLARVIAEGQPWKGSKLMLMNVNEFPKTHRCKAWIPGPPEDTGDIELKLRKQNPSLASSGVWRIVWVQHQEGGQVARFEMDEDAFKFLRSCLYKARLGSKFILVSPVEKS